MANLEPQNHTIVKRIKEKIKSLQQSYWCMHKQDQRPQKYCAPVMSACFVCDLFGFRAHEFTEKLKKNWIIFCWPMVLYYLYCKYMYLESTVFYIFSFKNILLLSHEHDDNFFAFFVLVKVSDRKWCNVWWQDMT